MSIECVKQPHLLLDPWAWKMALRPSKVAYDALLMGEESTNRSLINGANDPYSVVITGIAAVAFWWGQRAVLATQSTREARLPDTVKTISFILLILLMFGVVTGWLGGL
jgi:hypothetical protein